MIRFLLSQNDDDCVTQVVEASNSLNCDSFTPADVGKLYHHDDVVAYMLEQGCIRNKSDSEVSEFRTSGNDICVSPKYVYLSLMQTYTKMWRTIRISLERLLSLHHMSFSSFIVRQKCKHNGHIVQAQKPHVDETAPKGQLFNVPWSFRWFQ